jgi:uncharacterized protein YggE
MKRITFILLTLSVLSIICSGQDRPQPRVIEVSGSAERLIMPDVFTFKITLQERVENKQKITIEQQEKALRNELSILGVNVSNDLSIFDISSTYFRQKRIKDVLGTKDYRLKLRDLNKIASLQDLADRLNISRLDLIDTESSEITRHRQETKIEAIKAAKAKAQYLLNAIGERVGNAVFIQEQSEETPRPQYANYSANITSNTIGRLSPGVLDTSDDSLSFSQIKLRFVIVARFEIE